MGRHAFHHQRQSIRPKYARCDQCGRPYALIRYTPAQGGSPARIEHDGDAVCMPCKHLAEEK